MSKRRPVDPPEHDGATLALAPWREVVPQTGEGPTLFSAAADLFRAAPEPKCPDCGGRGVLPLYSDVTRLTVCHCQAF